MADDDFAETTTDPNVANDRNFYKVERWSADGNHVDELIFAGNRLDAAQRHFEAVLRRRPGGRYMIRQRGRVLRRYPAA